MTTKLLTPQSETEARDMVQAALAAGDSMDIVGGATKAGIGREMTATSRLSTAGLSGIVTYDPAEMVMTAKAGTPLATVQAALGEHGQMLAFEPMDYRGLLGAAGQPTIGGIFAANVSGPRRFVSGAARDSLIGVRFINGFGEVVMAGGRVMKNVTGLDIVKLMAGSFGTLGLLSELTFKVLPTPQDSATVIVSGPDDERASEIMAAVMGLSLEVSGAAFLPESCKARFLDGTFSDGGAVALRLEGLAFSVRERLEKLVAAVSGHGSIRQLDNKETTRLWSEIRDVIAFQSQQHKPLWRVSVAPMAGAKLLNALRMETGVDGYYDWQGGLLWLQMEADCDARALRALIWNVGGGHALLVRASAEDRRNNDIFEPQSPAVAELNKRIRLKFDPNGIFNPGRMG